MLAMTVAPEGVGGRFGVGVGLGVGVPDGWEPEPEEDGALGDPVNAVVVVPVVAVPAKGLAAPEAPHPSIQKPVRVSTPTAQNRFRFTYIRQPSGRWARLSGQTTEASTLDVSGESSRRITEFALDRKY